MLSIFRGGDEVTFRALFFDARNSAPRNALTPLPKIPRIKSGGF